MAGTLLRSKRDILAESSTRDSSPRQHKYPKIQLRRTSQEVRVYQVYRLVGLFQSTLNTKQNARCQEFKDAREVRLQIEHRALILVVRRSFTCYYNV